MSINKDPIFGGLPLLAGVNLVTANANLDGTGTLATLLTAGADGAIVTSLKAVTRATIATANAIRLFISIDGGTTKLFFDEKLAAVYTVAATTIQVPVIFVNKLNPDEAIWLPANAIVYGCPVAAGNLNLLAEYRNLTAAV